MKGTRQNGEVATEGSTEVEVKIDWDWTFLSKL